MRRRSRRGGFDRIGWVMLAAIAGVTSQGARADDISRGDAAWASRAQGEREGQPQSAHILQAVGFYERALAESPGSLEARWKLLRALHFAGDFASQGAAARREIFDRAREASGEGLDLLADQFGSEVRLDEQEPEAIRSWLDTHDVSPSDVARFYFWSAINWGAWSRDVGLLEAVRQGVANRLYRYTRIAIALEPDYDEGGALRLLGRLHAELPRVPFVSGWVDPDEAIPLVERAHSLAPANPGNRLLLALTLLDLAPERRGEALDLLDQVSRLTPRPSMRIEDLAMRQEARGRLETALVEDSA